MKSSLHFVYITFSKGLTTFIFFVSFPKEKKKNSLHTTKNEDFLWGCSVENSEN